MEVLIFEYDMVSDILSVQVFLVLCNHLSTIGYEGKIWSGWDNC